MRETISGAGPSGGGSSFSTRPDTLRSNDTFEGLLGLCAGPIKGPVRGLKSVRVNGTPIEDETGKLNFPDFTALFADGDPLKFPQIATLKLGAGGSPINIGTGLSNNAVSGNPWSTHTLTNLGANAVDLRFVVQQLYRQDKKGIYENTANLEIQMKPSGSTNWINPFNPNGNQMPAYSESGYSVDSSSGTVPGYLLKTLFPEETYNTMAARAGSGATQYLTIRGKTTSTYVRELRVRLPNTGAYANKSWDIRVRLVEPDSVDADPNFEKRTISWESITAVYDGNLGNHEDWRGLAWLQIYGKASDNFNGLPEVDGIYDTKIVSVPPSGVYDPLARLYSGTIWDGSWAKSFTTDPAWIINDAISDPISGIAAFVPGARLNKWDALELSKWASQQVPDGAGGTHPRYSLGIYVDQPQKADEFIRFLAGAVSSTAWDEGDGEWRLKVDKPETPSAIFTQENIEGEFLYSHTDVDTRFNDVTVVFNNEEFDFAEDRVRVQNFSDIAKVGRKPTKVVAVGCTNRQQALRWAVLRLRTNINEFRVVSFTTNRQGKILERFNQILVADGSLGTTLQGSKRTTGRIIANNGTTIQVRDPLRLEVGVAYKIHATIPNPAYQPAPTSTPTDPTWSQPTITVSRTVTNTSSQVGDVTTLYLNQAFPASVAANANVALEAVGLPTIPKVYRVLDVAYDDDGERVAISAVEVDTAKWAASDNATEAAFDNDQAPSIAPAPTNLTFHLDTYITDTQTRRTLNVQWQRPASRYTTSFNVRYRINQGVWRFLDETSDTVVEISDPEQGTYEFEITANDRRGRVSNPLKGSYDIAAQIDLPPAAGLTNEAANVAADYQGNVTDFSQGVGRFFLNNTLGIISTGVTYNVKAGSATGGLAVTIDANGNYTPTALTADQGQVTLQAHYGPFTIEKIFTLTKSRAGVPGGAGQPGAAAKGFFLQSNTQTIPFTPAGAPVDGTQVITFTGIRQNTTQNLVWSMTKIDGTAVAGGVTLTVAADTLSATLTHANFNTARGASEGVVVKATCDGLGDQISVVRVQAGAPAPNLQTRYSVDGATAWHTIPAAGDLYMQTSSDNGNSWSAALKYVGAKGDTGQTGLQGATGPTLSISAPIGGFTFVDGALSPASPQTITVSALVNGVATPVSWSIKKPDGTAIRTPAGTAASVAVTDTDLGANESIVVVGTYNTIAVPISLGRFYKLSQNSLDTIGYTRSNAVDAGGVLLNAAANGVLTISEKKTRIEPEIASIQATYAKYRAQAVTMGVSVTALDTAYNSLGAATGATTGYLAPFNASTNPNGTTIRTLTYATSIDLPTFTSYFKGYYDAEAALVSALSAKAATTSTWSGVSNDNGKAPADGAGTNFQLVKVGNGTATITGNSVKRTDGGLWDQLIVSKEYWPGTASVGGKLGGSNTFIGLTDSTQSVLNAGASYAQLNYGVHWSSAGVWYAYELGASVLLGSSFSASTQWLIIYDGVTTRYFADGVLVRSVAAPAGKAFYVGIALSGANGVAEIQFGAYGSNNWNDFGGNGLPAAGSGTTLQLLQAGSGTTYVIGNSVKRTDGNTDWTQLVYSKEYQPGTAYISGKLVTDSTFLGLADTQAISGANASASYSQLNFSVHRSNTGAWYAYELGTGTFLGSNFAAGTQWLITYDGVRVKYYADGVLMRTTTTTPGRKFYAGLVLGAPNAFVNEVQFGPFTQNNLDVIGDGSVTDWTQARNTAIRTSTSGGVFYTAYVDANGNTVNIDSEDLNAAGLRADGIAETSTRFFGAESGADKTANQQIVVSAPSAITINCDSNGTPISSPLSAVSNLPVVTKGGSSVRTTSSFSATFNNCSGTYNNTPNDPNRGQVTITGATSNTAWVDIVVTVGTVVMPFVRLYVYKSIAQAAAASPASGGTGTGPAQDSRALTNISTTTPTVMAGPFTIRAGAGGKITLQVTSDYDIVGMATGGVALNGKLQINLGSGMTDITTDTNGTTITPTAVTGTQATCYNNNMPGEPGMVDRSPGNISFTRQARGLTPGNDYQVQFVGWGTNTRTISPYGDVTGTAA